jgi:predicted nucleotidyltransferase
MQIVKESQAEPVSEISLLLPLSEKIKKVYSETEIWLFGSRARGDYRVDSDYDLFVIHNYTESISAKINDMIWEYGFDNDLFLTPLIISKQEPNFIKYKTAPIYKVIMKEGIYI